MTESRNDADPRPLDDLVGDIRFAMITTGGEAGLEARPLTVQRVEADAIWFLVAADSDWLDDRLGSVNVSFVADDRWVSVTGTATLATDSSAVAELTDPVSEQWFQDGQTPAALKVRVDHGQWWTSPGLVRSAIGIVRAKVTNSTPDIGSSGPLR